MPFFAVDLLLDALLLATGYASYAFEELDPVPIGIELLFIAAALLPWRRLRRLNPPASAA